MPIHTTHTRDAALRQLHRITRWLIAGSVVLTGVLSDVAANAFAGKTVKRRLTGTAGGSHANTKSTASRRKSPPHALKPPAQAPHTSTESHTPAASTPTPESSEPDSAQESAPAVESAPAQESSPAVEPAPAQESAPTPEATHESAPAQEPEVVVSGGS
jgi:hypothetical protein